MRKRFGQKEIDTTWKSETRPGTKTTGKSKYTDKYKRLHNGFKKGVTTLQDVNDLISRLTVMLPWSSQGGVSI